MQQRRLQRQHKAKLQKKKKNEMGMDMGMEGNAIGNGNGNSNSNSISSKKSTSAPAPTPTPTTGYGYGSVAAPFAWLVGAFIYYFAQLSVGRAYFMAACRNFMSYSYEAAFYCPYILSARRRFKAKKGNPTEELTASRANAQLWHSLGSCFKCGSISFMPVQVSSVQSLGQVG